MIVCVVPLCGAILIRLTHCGDIQTGVSFFFFFCALFYIWGPFLENWIVFYFIFLFFYFYYRCGQAFSAYGKLRDKNIDIKECLQPIPLV